MYDQIKLKNGLTLIGERLPHFRSVSVGVWIAAGSQYETRAENGLSHFLEHMLFKGTERRTARDIAEVRAYGLRKYGDAESWKSVEPERYIDALLRHVIAFAEDPRGVDPESGIEHYKHAACNLAFLAELLKGGPHE